MCRLSSSQDTVSQAHGLTRCVGFDLLGATTGRTGRPNLMLNAIGDSACPAPSSMLREAQPAAGLNRAARGPQRSWHCATRSGTAGRGPNRDTGPARAARAAGDRGPLAGRRSCVTRSGLTSSYSTDRLSLIDIVSSVDGRQQQQELVQALVESRRCLLNTRFKSPRLSIQNGLQDAL